MFRLQGQIGFADPLLTAVQHITRTAAMSNFQSIPTDCPQRERRGWLGDAQLSCETNMHNFDMGAAYTSFVQQIGDAQGTALSGSISTVSTVLSWNCVGIHNRRALPSPVCA